MTDPLADLEPGRALLLEVRSERLELERLRESGDRVSRSETVTRVARVVTEEGLGVAASTGRDGYDELIELARRSAELGAGSPVTYPDRVRPGDVRAHHDEATDPERLRELLETVEATVPEGVTLSAVSLAGTLRRVRIRVPGQDWVERRESTVSLSVDVIGEFSGFAWDAAVRPRDLDAESLTEEATAMASRSPETSPPKGRVLVAFDPVALSDLLNYTLVPALSGLEVAKGTSAFERRDLGSRVIEANVTALNDPLRDWWPGSYRFDDEGVEPSRVELVSEGRLRGLYTDLYSSERLGLESTGSGLGSRRPEPCPGNVIVRGDSSREELLEEADLVVRRVMGAHTASHVSGRFSVTGLWVEDPEGRRVKPCSLRGNALTDLLEASREVRRVGSTGAPHALVRCRVGMS
ncbi:MAG: metallopeptidase TldD-related protein [Euryarchaeota archaeon]